MSGPSEPTYIATEQYLTVVVRVVLDRRGHLVRGTVVDLDGAVRGRFVAWSRLGRTVRAVLGNQRGGRRHKSPRVQPTPLRPPTGPDVAPASDTDRAPWKPSRPRICLPTTGAGRP